MTFDEVVSRLGVLAASPALPRAPDILRPVMTDGRRRTFPDRDPATERPAAVLVLLAPGNDGEARVVLIERATYDGFHSGEVSLPGGKVEPGDANAEATALREASEEVGLHPAADGVRIVGRLDEFWISVSQFALVPVVAVADRMPALSASSAEVARILVPPIATFLGSGSIEMVERTIRGWPLRYGAYPVTTDDHDVLLVWGATARILGQLGAFLSGEPAGDPMPSVEGPVIEPADPD